MKNRIFMVLWAMLLVSWVIGPSVDVCRAAPVSIKKVKKVAINHMKKMKLQKKMKQKKLALRTGLSAAGEAGEEELTVSRVFTAAAEGDPVYYVLNLKPEGWVIVSADDVAHPIIAYSERGFYSEEDRPPQFDAWMDNIGNQIHGAIKARATPGKKTAAEWDRLVVATEDFDANNATSPPPAPLGSFYPASVGPLLSTEWNQGGKSTFCSNCWDILSYCVWYKSYDAYVPYESKEEYAGGLFIIRTFTG